MTIPPLRLYLTLSGGASLGAFEAGAAAALALAMRQLDAEEGQDATIDAVGGASAGALVGFFTAHALLNGIDPVELLRETWVDDVDLPLLLSTDSRSLLSFDRLRERLPKTLGSAAERADADRRQRRPIALHVQLTGLRGLSYPIPGLRRDSPIPGVTYADWGRFELRSGGGVEQMLEPEGRSPLDFALASAASPGGFAPQLLDRRPDLDGYRSRGIEGLPQSGRLWYTDGGLLGSEPLGRVLAAGRAVHGSGEDATEVHLLIDPRSEDASTERWSDPEAPPTWQQGASRALAILSEQSLFDDLRRIEKQNRRIEWARRLGGELAGELSSEAVDALARFVAEREGERGIASEERDPGALVHRALCELAGLVGKERIAIDVISPELLEGELGEDVGSLLAGEFMGDFGGFLDRGLRESDFALGYESSLAWLRAGLAECGIAQDLRERTIAFVEDRHRHRLEDVGEGGARLADLSLSERLQLVRLAAHATRVLAAGAIDLRTRIPDVLGRALRRTRDRLRG